MITLIAAMDDDRIIGRDGRLPWHVPGDLAFFRRTTTGHVVIYGRQTWGHIAEEAYNTDGPWLADRVNFVVTRQPQRRQDDLGEQAHRTFGPHFVDTIELAISTARRRFPEYATEIFICGGRQIYELALRRDLVDRMLITHVHGKHIGDTTFPPIGPEWTSTTIEQEPAYHIDEYTRP